MNPNKKILVYIILFIVQFLGAQVGRCISVDSGFDVDKIDTTITIKAISGMQYDIVRWKIKPGSRVKLVFENSDDMSHNLVITTSKAREKVVEAGMSLAERGPEMDFIPNIPEVKWSIPVVSPGEKKTLVFTAPDDETILPYVCTYPGHGYIMYGAIYVTTKELPALETDINIPINRRGNNTITSMDNHESMNMADHPYALTPPYFYRIFMPNASPASIAVRLTDDLSYCWDAGSCQLLYTWRGGFIDNSVAWKGHKNTEAKLLGTVEYQNNDLESIRIGDKNNKNSVVEYLGFELKDGYPEFHYTINGVHVYELITCDASSNEMVQTIRIPDAGEDVWINTVDGVQVLPGIGDKGWTRISPAEASEISIVIPQKMK